MTLIVTGSAFYIFIISFSFLYGFLVNKEHISMAWFCFLSYMSIILGNMYKLIDFIRLIIIHKGFTVGPTWAAIITRLASLKRINCILAMNPYESNLSWLYIGILVLLSAICFCLGMFRFRSVTIQ
jgi:hypothetical protein